MVVDDESPDGTGAGGRRARGEFAGPRRRAAPHGQARPGPLVHRRAADRRAGRCRRRSARWTPTCRTTRSTCRRWSRPSPRATTLVIGSRYLQGVSVVNWPLHRLVLSAFANRYIRAVTGCPFTTAPAATAAGGARPSQRIPLDRIVSDGYAFLVEMLYEAHWREVQDRRSAHHLRRTPRSDSRSWTAACFREPADAVEGRPPRSAAAGVLSPESGLPARRRARAASVIPHAFHRDGRDVVSPLPRGHGRHLHGAHRARHRRTRTRGAHGAALAPAGARPAREGRRATSTSSATRRTRR